MAMRHGWGVRWLLRSSRGDDSHVNADLGVGAAICHGNQFGAVPPACGRAMVAAGDIARKQILDIKRELVLPNSPLLAPSPTRSKRGTVKRRAASARFARWKTRRWQ